MRSEEKASEKIRADLTRALKFMNRYGLTEFEYKDPETSTGLKLVRSETESSPPLLEGRGVEIPGVIFSPSVGKIEWRVNEGDFVEEGQVVALIHKHRRTVEVIAPLSGSIIDLLPAEPVEFGEKLARIETGEVGEDEE